MEIPAGSGGLPGSGRKAYRLMRARPGFVEARLRLIVGRKVIIFAGLKNPEVDVIELVLGGARSGKSAYAEAAAKASGLGLYYIATATALDEEMKARVIHHQVQRSPGWVTIEEPLRLAMVLQENDSPHHCILVDCLTLWLTNNLLASDKQCWEREKHALLQSLPQLVGQIILVSNEVGMGIVPIGEINRKFVDEAGWLHQAIASHADKVTLVTAGLPMTLKETGSRNN